MTEMLHDATVRTDEVGEDVMAACPELAEVLDLLAMVDRATADAVDLIARLQQTGEVEAATGLPLELWLSVKGRRTRSDRRMLTTTADVLERLPNVADAFSAGMLSWAQVRAIVLKCERLPRGLCHQVDEALADHLLDLRDAEPDHAVYLVSQALASLDPADVADRRPTEPRERFLALQPRLDGSGGSVYGEFDGLGFAVVDQATDPGPDPGAPHGRARADRLVGALARSLSPGTDGSTAAGAQDGDPAAAGARDGDPAAGTRDGDPGDDAAPLPVAPTLLLTMPLDSLLGRDHTPAEVLTTLLGGRLKVSAATARRLLDEGGAAVRTIVLDATGRTLGVGRRVRVARGWLREALLACQPTCAEPGCDRSSLICDLDHVRDWERGGRTDLDNLQPLCVPANRTGRKQAWRIQTCDDGSRVWTHRRSGLTVRTLPATRRLTLRVTGAARSKPGSRAASRGDRPGRAPPG